MHRVVVGIGIALFAIALLGVGITGFAMLEKPAVVREDTLSLSADTLQVCCRFEREGANKTCAVIAPYDCGYCAEYCK